MTSWRDFEEGCFNYLNEEFGSYAKFTHKGGSDSTVSDILVETHSGKSFYIEAKQCPAQCRQFVLIPDQSLRAFEYSPRNLNPINKYSRAIMNFMDEHFDEFVLAGTSGIEIDLPNSKSIFSSWIIDSFMSKGVDFIITNDFNIVQIEHFAESFDVSATYRVKRSGSSDAGKHNMESLKNYISSREYTMIDFRTDGDKLFLVLPENLDKKRFTYYENEYMFSRKEDGYEIRKLSNTHNANVIFSIELKVPIKSMSDAEFISYLR